MAASIAPTSSDPSDTLEDTRSDNTIDCILQEITTVGRRLEAIDSKITKLTTKTKSIRADIAGFQDRVMEFDHCLTQVEDRIDAMSDDHQKLQLLQNKLTDLEDRSHRHNVRFFGIPEREEGTDITTFLTDLLSGLTGLAFSPTLEFQCAHRIGPLHSETSGKPHPIIVCFLRHKQVRQLLMLGAPTVRIPMRVMKYR
ncbi:hypothetical protein NDU88_002660 [Pleurodeles waltl]|uniref:Uncharacterized protein n=1 Tax=Pleurodeles waltl TaxID=8319 RepID=A0AAV7SF71_PLEWA|nr:hypothetical protein NDU88_002660 [Pleurodeles waltl]